MLQNVAIFSRSEYSSAYSAGVPDQQNFLRIDILNRDRHNTLSRGSSKSIKPQIKNASFFQFF